MIHKVIRHGDKAFFINAALWGGLFGNYTYYRIYHVERNFFDEVRMYQKMYNPALDS